MQTQFVMFVVALFVSQAPLLGQVTALPPGSIVAGLTLEEWSAEWWKWQLGLQTPVSPILDTSGLCAHQGQSGPVFFIGGGVTTGGETNYVTRTATISSDLYVFFPIINWTGENVGRAVPLSAQELRDEVITLVSSTLEARADVDGADLPPDRILRLLAPVFSYTVPDGSNIFRYFGLDLPGGIVDPAVSDGYWVMLAPLPAGKHVVHLFGVAGDPFNVGFDATYRLTVVPPSLSYDVGVLISLVRCVRLPSNLERPLLASLTASQASFERNHLHAGLHQLLAFQQKVRGRLSRSHPDLANDLIHKAQVFIDRAKAALRRENRGDEHEERR